MLGHCSACTYHNRPVPGQGPRPCLIAVLGEGPAKDEIRRGYPFAGRSGEEVDFQYFPLAKLQRPQVYISNVSKCPFPGFRNPTPEEALTCARCHLGPELAEVAPKVIITLGAVAASVFDTTFVPGGLGRPVDLELDHGRYTRASFGQWSGWLIPTYHPAAGMRDARYIQAIREDFSALPLVLRMLLDESDWRLIRPLVEDAYPKPDYREIETEKDLWLALCFHGRYQDIAMDTESHCLGGPPFSLQFSLRPGTGCFIDASRRDLVSTFAAWLQRFRPMVAFHHALHDLEVLLDMDPPVHVPRWVDTLMLAYHAQFFSHGLKPLAYRMLGMAMQDFDEVVGPPSIAAVESHAIDVVMEIESQFMAPHTFKSGARKGQAELRWPPDHDPGLRDTYNRYVALARDIQSPSRPASFDPWKRHADWKPEVSAWGEALAGKFPVKSIAHVPRQDAIYYACRDADSTLRLLPLLRRIAARVGDNVMRTQ